MKSLKNALALSLLVSLPVQACNQGSGLPFPLNSIVDAARIVAAFPKTSATLATVYVAYKVLKKQ